MKPKYTWKYRLGRPVAALLLLTVLFNLCACATWEWMWTRIEVQPPDSNDVIIEGNLDVETDKVFEGAVEFTDGAHSGTDIYYIGKAGHSNRNRIIVIDAGHQLHANGSHEPNGPDSTIMKTEVSESMVGVSTKTQEHELTLNVALLLRNVLIARGYSVVMIRETNNVNISDMKRAQIANKYSAAAFISIHANGDADATVSGAATVCASPSNPYPGCVANYRCSQGLSAYVLDAFCKKTSMEQLPIREKDDRTTINWSEVPTTVVEMGYLTNSGDDHRMASNYFYQMAANGIADGLDAYFADLELHEIETGSATEEAMTDGSKISEPVKDESPTEASLLPVENLPVTETLTQKEDATDEQPTDRGEPDER